MNEVLHANIFFFITGIAVIICTALLCVALFHGIKVLTSIRRILYRVEEGTELIAEDMQHIRAYFAEDGILLRLIKKLFGKSQSGNEEEERTKRSERKRTSLKIKDEA
jgi:hypothetical protein